MMERRRMDAALLLLFLVHLATALEVPLDLLEGLPQPPTITHQSPKDYIIDPRENIIIHCEAKGKPHPSFSWTRNGTHFDIDQDPNVTMKPHSGTMEVDISRAKAEHYESVYQCTARNKHGTAVSNNIVVQQSRSPLWSKEKIKPSVVQEGVSLVLPCRPPAGLPPPIIFWMDNNFQRLPQSSRVSQSLNGDLYFSNVLREDSRNDYICYARFPYTQTIQQKQPITVKVLNLDAINDTMAAFYNDTDLFSEDPADERRPTFLIPSGPTSSKMVLRGQVLEMECIAEGLPTPGINWNKVSGDLPTKRTSFLHYNKTLRIVNVSESDAGDYRCIAKNRHGLVHHTIHVTVKAAPYWITGAPRNLVLAPGENGVLTCRASGTPKPSVNWAMNGIPIENSPKDLSRKVEDDTIIFTVVQTGSSAVYQCNVSNDYGYLLSNAFVNVLSEPPRVLTPANKVYQVIKNHLALIDCASFGSPIPKITWFKDSRSSTLDGDPYILHDNGTLEIHIAQAHNSGEYTCVARNSLGIFENHVRLEVKDPTRILKQPEYKVVQRGRPVVFECKVKHDPSLIPTMTWLKDDGELPDDERLIVDSDSLTINDVTENDAGVYTCIMNTTLDHDSASAELTVVEATPTPAVAYEQPDAPTDLELTDQKKRSVQLTWTPGDEHNSPIQKFLIQYEDSLHHRGHWHNLTEVPGTRTTAHLKLSPYIHYTFRVLALNAVGFSRSSFPSRMFKTEPAAPDDNPTGVQGFGTEHDNLVISWKPLTGLQSNGPGLHYKVMWRQKAVDSDWTTVTVANNSKFVVSGTPTFVPYELKVQAVNDHGAGPEPAIAHGYSGEDLPVAAPQNVQAMLLNSTLAEVHWDPVPSKLIRGHLKGYKVYYGRERSLHKHNPHHEEKQMQILTFSGNHTHGMLPSLHPFSHYSFHVRVFNGKGEGPPSDTLTFDTPEGVPGAPTSLVVTNPNLNALTLEWSPPHDRNGRITGYTLKYQPVNNSNELGPVEELALPANETSVTLKNLKYSTRYKFYLNAKTARGAGLATSQEAVTIVDEAVASRQVDIATQGWFIGLMCAIALLILILLIICFIQRNKGGKYPVKEKEDAHTDPEFQPMKDDDCTFGEYSDNEDHKPLKGSRTPSSGTVKRDDSDDSLVDYGEGGDGQFNEDGSFIGQYSGKSASRETAEGHESSEAPSPINAMNSLNSFV
ncbi:neuronal cell adhesion molecule-like isoform X12 [Sebastes umbrosus]|uniref:neuronal cell adhesion molecule-like isoform X12 n=1 Tax=Sebastes umbrosus TaxID=72105 RepID=UPI0018A10CCF|nr:neuronal cell adhesion molecule-like isoform X12 [Sebastes umbrosus]